MTLKYWCLILEYWHFILKYWHLSIEFTTFDTQILTFDTLILTFASWILTFASSILTHVHTIYYNRIIHTTADRKHHTAVKLLDTLTVMMMYTTLLLTSSLSHRHKRGTERDVFYINHWKSNYYMLHISNDVNTNSKS